MIMWSLRHRFILVLFALMQISYVSAQSYRDYMRSGTACFVTVCIPNQRWITER